MDDGNHERLRITESGELADYLDGKGESESYQDTMK